MKTAVLISGQLRTFRKCYPTQKWQIFRHYEPDIHFFTSICDDEQAKDIELLQNDYPETIYCERYQDPSDLPDIPVEKGKFAPYANAASHYKLMLQHWGNKKVWDFFASSAATESFDVIIRIRPDLWIHRFEPPRFEKGETNTAFLPWWGKFGGVNDRLAIMGNVAAEAYFNVYDEIQDLLHMGCPFHPETLVASALMAMSVKNTVMTEFSTERMDGSRRWAEIQMSDVAELISSAR